MYTDNSSFNYTKFIVTFDIEKASYRSKRPFNKFSIK